VVCRPGPGAAAVVGSVMRRFPPRLLLAPAGSTLPGATVATAGETLGVGGLAVTVDAVDPKLVVRVGPGPAAPQAVPGPAAPQAVPGPAARPSGIASPP